MFNIASTIVNNAGFRIDIGKFLHKVSDMHVLVISLVTVTDTEVVAIIYLPELIKTARGGSKTF